MSLGEKTLTNSKSFDNVPIVTLTCSNKRFTFMYAPCINWENTSDEVRINPNRVGQSLLFLTKIILPENLWKWWWWLHNIGCAHLLPNIVSVTDATGPGSFSMAPQGSNVTKHLRGLYGHNPWAKLNKGVLASFPY